ncbi:hypothetical protein A9G39_04410 [Gilliamella sp. Imp1-6]|nr:hypothetical protein A9G39_04410 [Gilliamella apicola]
MGARAINLNDLINQGNWKDDDGDGQGINAVTASGSVSLKIEDYEGNIVNRGDALTLCRAPYKITLSSTNGTLVTQYGVPDRSKFNGGSVDYYITLPVKPTICSARPNLLLGGLNKGLGYEYIVGPVNIWSQKRGFLVQSTNPSSYGQNFPTTGSDGLYFDLDIIGAGDARQFSWRVITNGDIGATIRWRLSNQGVNEDRWITDKVKYVTRVTLHGPEARSQWNDANPSQITVPSLPQKFELVGRDSSGNELRYGFVLKQWFVNRGSKEVNVPRQTTWCDSLGYRMPKVSDLTNATCSGWNSVSDCRGAVGATPSSGNNAYQRRIGAGFFTEWGYMDHYADADFVDGRYWTSDVKNNHSNFYVRGDRGDIYGINRTINYYGVCTTP